MKGLRIRIGRDGKVYAETVGITGEVCLTLIPVVEELTAARTVRSEYLPEFYQHEAAGAARVEDADTDDAASPSVTEREPW